MKTTDDGQLFLSVTFFGDFFLFADEKYTG